MKSREQNLTTNPKDMKKLELDKTPSAEETLLSYKDKNFLVKNCATGQYGFERRVVIFIIETDCKKVVFKNAGVLKLFDNKEIAKTSKSEQCLIIGETTFENCLKASVEYIKKFVDFIV